MSPNAVKQSQKLLCTIKRARSLEKLYAWTYLEKAMIKHWGNMKDSIYKQLIDTVNLHFGACQVVRNIHVLLLMQKSEQHEKAYTYLFLVDRHHIMVSIDPGKELAGKVLLILRSI